VALDPQEKAQLVQALTRLQQLQAANASALTTPVNAMRDHSWVGPSARSYDHELERHAKALPAQLAKAISLIEDKLRQG
jgi:hypothetical protein